MSKKCNKIIALLVTFSLLLTAFAAVATAAPGSSQDQITQQGRARYYSSRGAEVTSSPVLGSNSVVSVAKTIEGTDIENEFIINMEVKTSVDISELKVTKDSAVILTLDVSASMAGYMPTLKAAANNFLDSYVAQANGAARYAALVVYDACGTICMGWTDVSNVKNLNNMKYKINCLSACGSTFTEGGLMMARNLLRTEAMPCGRDGKPIANRSVILFADGDANRYTKYTSVGYTAGTTIKSTYGPGYDADYTSMSYAAAMANTVKYQSFFSSGKYTYGKYDAKLFTIAFGSSAPTAWLANTIATSSSYAYTAANAAQLNNAFGAIAERIESWAEALVVTDPMGQNINFITNIPQADINSGLLKFENNTLSWDLKKATPNSFGSNIYTYNYSYRIRLNTTGSTYAPEVSYPTNGTTTLTYVMVVGGVITSDIMTATFAVPAVKGLMPRSEPPEIDTIYAGASTINGNGIPGATVTVMLPNGSTVNATVNSSGRWTVSVPAGVELVVDDAVSAVQQEVGKSVSERVYKTVIEDPIIDPGVDLYVENLTTGQNSAKAGDTLLYDVIVTNKGNPSSLWESAFVTLSISNAVRLQESSIRINNRTVTSSQYDYDGAENTLTLYLGDIPGGGGFSISFRTMVNDDITDIEEVVLDAELGSLLARGVFFRW